MEVERLAYDLTADSLVWDVGAFRGDFSDAIIRRFRCRVMAFEPVFVAALREQFWECEDNIKIFPFGLADRNFTQAVRLADDRTSAFQEADREIGYRPGPLVPAIFRDAAEFMEDHHVTQVDLVKINIEGGEYALLRRLIDAGKIAAFRHLQVQFHTFIPQFGELYKALEADLKRTHTLSWRTPWVWESWSRNP